MTRHLEREIDKLKKRLLGLAAIVEDSVQTAVRSVVEMDPALVKRVIESDGKIDQDAWLGKPRADALRVWVERLPARYSR